MAKTDIIRLQSQLKLPDLTLAQDPRVRAAVTVILTEHTASTQVLLIRRALREGDPWSGHIALPGGHRDATDANLLMTAIRETREEVGIDLTLHGRALGALSNVEVVLRKDVGGMALLPFVFAVDQPMPLLFQPSEVADAFWVGVDEIRQSPPAKVTLVRDGDTVSFDALHVRGEKVWGLTYRVMTELFEILGL